MPSVMKDLLMVALCVAGFAGFCWVLGEIWLWFHIRELKRFYGQKAQALMRANEWQHEMEMKRYAYNREQALAAIEDMRKGAQ